MAKGLLEGLEIKTRSDTCEQHGPFEARNIFGAIWTRCPECARIRDEKRAKEEAEQKAQEKAVERQRRIEQLVGQAGIPFRFMDRTIDRFVAETPAQQKAFEFAKRYAEGFEEVYQSGRCALFLGRPGTGKTHLAVGIGLHVMREFYRTVMFSTVLRMIRRVKDTWSRESSETESSAIKAFARVDLLILDEIGVQFGSEAERTILFDIVNERYENRMPTILLSNLPVEEVKRYLGERVFDRLREDGGQAIPFDWGSWRGKAAA